jgi:hypothetical protein
MWLAVLVGCSDYVLNGNKDPGHGGDDTDDVIDTGLSSVETCNGLDDDGDGDIDEGFPDKDADGIKDCLDSDCEVTPEGPGAVEVETECVGYDPAEVTDPWDLDLEWQFTGASYSVVSPVFGLLSPDDVPDIVFVGWYDGIAHEISGDGSGEICEASGFSGDSGVIVADVDGDGENDIVGSGADGHVLALNADCTVKWRSAGTYPFMYPVTTAADLDGDGDVEVISDVAVVEGADGSNVATLAPNQPTLWRTPVVGDLDLDGKKEIILGNTVFNARGKPLWSVTPSGFATSCFAALVNVDSDDEAEVAFSCGAELILTEDDGTIIGRKPLSVSNPGPPCAGDIDGDGEVEIIAPAGSSLTAFNADLSTSWSDTMQDYSGAAGCAVFDMNGDEVYEVLFADEIALRVYDGKKGKVLYQNTSHGSVTYFETPTIGDVDNDGSAEMVVSNSSGAYGAITVFGHAGSGWPAAGPTWGIHDFAATNQESDGSIPADPEPSWLAYNVFRGRPYQDIPGSADLLVDITDVCVSSCDPAAGTVEVAYQVSNRGGIDSVETTVALYLKSGSTETLFGTQVVPVVASGMALAGGTFSVPVGQWGDGARIVIDDDGTSAGVNTECDETNNSLDYNEPFCD